MPPETAAVCYPSQSLGRAFGRALERWGIPEARLAGYLGVGDAAAAALALCPVPDDASSDGQLDALAARFGADPLRLAFLYRAGRGEAHRLRAR